MRVRQVIHIGQWQAFPDLDKLRKGKVERTLLPKEMDLLVYLASRKGEVVSADEIIHKIWHGVPSGDDTVYVTMSRLRRALGDSASNPDYIKTIPKRGYRLVADVHTGNVTRNKPFLKVLLATAGLVSLFLVLSLYVKFTQDNSPAGPPWTIAVLPFVNLTNDPDQAYVADGIAEEILNELTRFPDIRVVARTSSFQFKGKQLGIPDIGRQLNVAYILEGSLRNNGAKVRTTAQLVAAKDGFHLWSKTFDRKLDNVFTVPTKIAGAIASALEVKANTTVSADSVHSTNNLQAFKNYLKASELSRRWRPEDVGLAIELLKTATELDPHFANAHALLGQAYLFSGLPDARDQSIASLLRAIEIDPANATALAILGYVRLRMDWDWDAAEALIRRAYVLAPSSSNILHWYSIYLAVTGKLSDSLAIEQKAAALDPLNYAAQGSPGQRYIYLGRFEDARDVYLDVERTFPESKLFDIRLADVYRYMGDLENAQRVLDGLWPEMDAATQLRYRFLMADERGDTASAQALTDDEILPLVKAGRYPFYWYADCLARLGRMEEAIKWYQRSVDRRESSFIRYVLYPLPSGLVEQVGWRKLWRTPPLNGLRMLQLEAGEIAWQRY